MKKYFLKAIKFNNDKAMDYLINFYKPSELYVILSSVKNKNYLINNKITELLNLPQIIYIKNKINDSIKNNIIHECTICMEDNKLNICGNCTHFMCIDCYSKMDKCPYCRIIFL